MKRIILLLILMLLITAGKTAAQCVDAGTALTAICQGQTTGGLGGSFTGEATSAIWSDGGAGGIFTGNGGTSPSTATYTAAANSPSSVTLTLTAHGGACEGTTVTKTLTVNPNPTVNAGGAIGAICQGGTTGALGGSFGGGATSAIWSDGGAGGSFSNNGGSTPGTTTYTASPTAPSTVTLTLTTSGGSCGNVNATKSLTVNGAATANAGTSVPDICKNTVTIPLGGSVGGSATGGKWTSSSGGSFSPNDTDLNATWTPVNNYSGTTTLTLTTSGGCTTATDTKTVKVQGNISVDAGGAIGAVCQGLTTAALGGSYGSGATSAVWDDGGAGGTFTNNGGNHPDLTTYTTSATSASSVTLTLTAHGGCGDLSESKTLTVYTNPQVDIGTPLSDLCQGIQTPDLGGSFGGSATSAIWSDGGAGGTFINNTGTTPGTARYTPLTSASPVNLRLTTSGGSCGTTFAFKQLTVKPTPVANNQSLAVCEDSYGSGTKSAVNLNLLENSITGGATFRSVNWYSDAVHSTAVPSPGNVTVTNGQIFYPLVTNTSSLCTNSATATYTVNSKPIASGVQISGSVAEGSTVTADYTYTQGACNAEVLSKTEISWYVASDNLGGGESWVATKAATDKTFLISSALIGNYLKVCVRTSDGTTPLAPSQCSGVWVGPVVVNASPVATSVLISGTTKVKSLLTASYTFYDAENDPEGASVFQWLSGSSSSGSNPQIIAGANDKTYLLSASDLGNYIGFRVQPVATRGSINGSPVTTTLWVGPVTNDAPVASSLSISGTTVVGNILTANYTYSDNEGDLEGNSLFQWYSGDNSSGLNPQLIPGATSRTYRLTNNEFNDWVGFIVTPVAKTGTITGLPVTSPTWSGKITNPPPVSTVPVITGSRNVGSNLIGQYTYSDAEGDLESGSHYQWSSATSVGGTYTNIINDTALTHMIQPEEQGRFFKFSVTPKTATGSKTGTTVITPSGFGPINTRPSASGLSISGTPVVGSILTGKYNFSDIDLDARGTGLYRWFKDGIVITGATDSTYLLKPDDAGFTIGFEIQPVSVTGYPNTGDAVTFTMIASVSDPMGTKPVASGVCIDGRRSTGSIITGKYTYTYSPKQEGNSAYQWYLDSIPIPGENSITYTLKSSDLSHYINFRVTPKSANHNPVVGNPVISPPLAWFNMSKYNYSVSDSDVTLQAKPGGGYFWGTGVLNGKFSPRSIDYSQSPFTVTYHLDTASCGQDAVADFSVSPNTAFFKNIKPFYCQNGGNDTIKVVGFKNKIKDPLFTYTDPNAVLTQYHDSLVILKLSTFRPSSNQDVLTFTATDSVTGSAIIIPQALVVDAIRDEKIIIRDTVFCNSSDRVDITTEQLGGDFSFPVVKRQLDPSLVSADTSLVITYTYKSALGCTAIAGKRIYIHPAPIVDFTVADSCIKSGIETSFINNTTPKSVISRYIWSINDAGVFKNDTINIISGLEDRNTYYQYQKGGYHKIILYATSKNNCSSYREKTIEFATRPNADFVWWNFCRHPDDFINFSDSITTSDTKITSTTWQFVRSWASSDTIRKDDLSSVKLLQDSIGLISVKYIARTAYKGCTDTASKELYIRPTVEFDNKDYFEDFENGHGGWEISETDTANWWDFGMPSRKTIHTAASGSNAWYIRNSPPSLISESSSVVSPCFDFTNLTRPMIRFKMVTNFNYNRDGAALQYKIGDETTWNYIGTLDDGINWYNSTLIAGRPGGEQTGWTSGTDLDLGWGSAEHKLDDLKGKKDVRLRIIYGSNGTSVDNEGLAFDDIWIGSRTRGVLMENFTNDSYSAARTAASNAAKLANTWPEDLINIQYHTNFPGSDTYYNENPGDVSARVLSYGLSRTPYTFIDGGTGLNYAKLYDYILSSLNANDVNNRSMTLPGFDIKLKGSVESGTLNVRATVKALAAYTGMSDMRLYFAVTQRVRTVLPNKDTVYLSIFRKFIPDAGGIILKSAWNDKDTVATENYTWTINNIPSGSDIDIIAFLQDKITKEVYQAVTVTSPDIAVGIDDLFSGTDNDFALYPNPAASKVTIAFKDPVRELTDISVYDYSGSLVKIFRIGSGGTEFTIDDLGLSAGIYLVRVSSHGVDHGFKKLVVSDK